MLSSIKSQGRGYFCRFAPIVFIAVAMLLSLVSGHASAAAKAEKQMTFASPEEAVQSLFDALKNKDSKALSAILGPDAKDLISSGDPVSDKETCEQAAKLYEEKHKIVKEGDAKAILQMGGKDWPMPIPMVASAGKWRFDTKAGKQEIIDRRIGRNELNAIQVCLAYVDGQREYASVSRRGDGVLEYAQQFASSPGKKDGLYWETKEGEPQSPIGLFVANAKAAGYERGTPQRPVPYHGYFYRIIKAQGKNAPGGAFDYVVKGRMIGGFALVAYPAKYGASGIMTFIVNHDGVVHQKNLGPQTAAAAKAIKLFDPDKTWQKVK